MCRKASRKLDKFVQRFKQGDYGYCTHRLRKSNRRHTDVLRAATIVVQQSEPGDVCEALAGEVLKMKNELIGQGLVTETKFNEYIFRFASEEQAERFVGETNDEELLPLVKQAVSIRDDGASELAVRRYIEAQKRQGLATAIRRGYDLLAELTSDDDPLRETQAVAYLKNCLLHELKEEALEDFTSFFRGGEPSSVCLADDCTVKNDFRLNGTTLEIPGFLSWVKGLLDDRGPLVVDTANGLNLLKEGAFIDGSEGWLETSVAVVRQDGDPSKALFVALIGNDLSDGTIQKVWLSTDNSLWNLEFENPLHNKMPVVPQPSLRPARPEELAKKIVKWNARRTDRSFTLAIWAIGVDAVFGKTVFVPASFDEDGKLKVMGPAGRNDTRLYVAYVDLPAKATEKTLGFAEIPLSSFLKMVLSDGQATGIAVHLGDIQFFVCKKYLADMSEKIGLLLNGKEANDATKEN